MASISSDYYSISSYAKSRTAFTGLASGLDTDSIIETMMKGYQSRLDTLYQKRDKTEWKIEAYRDVSNSLLDFQKKYLSSTSSSSIFSSGFFQSATITSKGKNASAVTVSGGVNDVKNFQVKEVTQLAKTSTLTSGVYGSQHAIYSDFNIADAMSNGRYYSSLEGQTLNLSVGGATYNLKLSDIAVSSGSSGDDYAGDAANIVKAMNESLQEAGIGNKVEAKLSNGKVSLVAKNSSAGTVKISGGGKTLLNTLGLSTGQTTSYGGSGINGTEVITNTKTYDVSNLSSLKGKSITFDLDGVSKKITFNDDYKNSANKAMAFSDIKDEKDLVAYLNGKLKDSFGDKVGVSLSTESDAVGAGRLKFETKDATAILSIATGETGTVGASSVLGLNVGDANRLLRFEKIADSNSNLSQAARDSLRNGGSQDVTINGTTFSVYADKIVVTGTDGKETTHDFEGGTTIANLQDVINNSDIGATVKYSSSSDKFTLTATESGSLGEVKISYSDDSSKNALTNALFGTKEQTSGDLSVTGAASIVAGQDAEAIISLDGGNTWETVSRSNNSFTLDGMNVTLNETFSAQMKDDDGNVTGVNEADIVTFSGKANTDEMFEKIREFVEEYNNIARAVNSQLSARPDSDYQPLTSAQKEELSEDQIKRYEEKAKVGLLAGDSTLRSLSTDLRFAMSMPTGGDMLSSIGISNVSYLTDPTGSKYGLLEIDEDKLRKALETDPDRVEKLFVGSGVGSSDEGVLNRLNSVMNKYASTSSIPEKRGLLILKAGNEANSLTLKDNFMYRELSTINDQIDSFIEKMQAKQESYYNQFASLEVYINQMNQQSSWLSSSLGTSY